MYTYACTFVYIHCQIAGGGETSRFESCTEGWRNAVRQLGSKTIEKRVSAGARERGSERGIESTSFLFVIRENQLVCCMCVAARSICVH